MDSKSDKDELPERDESGSVVLPQGRNRLAGRFPSGRDEDERFGGRRQARRWPLNAEVEFLAPAGVQGITLNVSRGGLRLAVNRQVEIGALCLARIYTEGAFEAIESMEIVWRRQAVDGWLLGARFEDHSEVG